MNNIAYKILELNKKIIRKAQNIEKENKEIQKQLTIMIKNNKILHQENQVILNELDKIEYHNTKKEKNQYNYQHKYQINYNSKYKSHNYGKIDILLGEIELNNLIIKKLEEKKCSICLEIYSVGSKICYLPCLHYFHGTCIKNWIKREKICPLCNIII